MRDTALSLWQELFKKRDGDPSCAAEIQGALYCWFCGMPSLNEGDQLHELECIWILCYRPRINPKSPRRLALAQTLDLHRMANPSI